LLTLVAMTRLEKILKTNFMPRKLNLKEDSRNSTMSSRNKRKPSKMNRELKSKTVRRSSISSNNFRRLIANCKK
jgi:hypothetical protein